MTASSPSNGLPWGLFERLRPDQIEAIRATRPVAYVPWGALEWHSHHAPIGLDGLMAHGLASALARACGGVVLPPVYAGTDTIKPFKGFRHTLEHAPETIERLCSEYLAQLDDEGFRVLVVVSGHSAGGHLGALRAAVDGFTARAGPRALLVAAFDPVRDVYPPDHAAHGETSLQLLFAPDLVDLGRIPAGPPPTLDADGVWGADPRTASAEDGAAILDLFVHRTHLLLQPLFDRYLP